MVCWEEYMKKKFVIGILIVIVLFLIFGFKDIKGGFENGFNAAIKTEHLN
jgi:hypothetical protein